MESDYYTIEVFLPSTNGKPSACSMNCSHCPLGIDRAGTTITDFNKGQLDLLTAIERHIKDTRGEIRALLFGNSLLSPEIDPTAIPISTPPHEFVFDFGMMTTDILGDSRAIADAIHKRSAKLLGNLKPRSTRFSIGFRPPDIDELEGMLKWDWVGMTDVSIRIANLIANDPDSPFKKTTFSSFQNLNGMNPKSFGEIRNRVADLYAIQRRLFEVTRQPWIGGTGGIRTTTGNLYDDDQIIEAREALETTSGFRIERGFRLINMTNRPTPINELETRPDFAFAVLGDHVWVDHASSNTTDPSLRFSFQDFKGLIYTARSTGKSLRSTVVKVINQRRLDTYLWRTKPTAPR